MDRTHKNIKYLSPFSCFQCPSFEPVSYSPDCHCLERKRKVKDFTFCAFINANYNFFMRTEHNQIFYGIGGGSHTDDRMLRHHEEIVNIAQLRSCSKKPRIVLMPTAHHNGTHPELRQRQFYKNRFAELGCIITEILIGDVLQGETEDSDEMIRQKLDASDCLFVLGGDTQLMLKVIHARNLNGLFTNFYQNGLPFTGTSAGCIWVAKEFMSDSDFFQTPQKWKYIMLSGLDLLPSMNVHDNQGVRKGVVPQLTRGRQFDTFMQERENGRALAIDEFAAIYVTGNECLEVISSDNSGVQLVTSFGGNVYRERIAEPINLSDYF